MCWKCNIRLRNILGKLIVNCCRLVEYEELILEKIVIESVVLGLLGIIELFG